VNDCAENVLLFHINSLCYYAYPSGAIQHTTLFNVRPGVIAIIAVGIFTEKDWEMAA
jgi:hypothetical protein